MKALLLFTTITTAVTITGCSGAPGTDTGTGTDCDVRACADAPAWTFAAAGGISQSTAVAVDGAGDVYAVGAFGFGTDLGAGGEPAAGAFFSKFTPNGDVAWTLTMPQNLSLTAVAVDGLHGQIDVAGVLTGPLVLQGEALASSSGRVAPFVAAFDANGGLLWAKTLGSALYLQVDSISVARDGTVGVGGMQVDETSIDAYLAEVDARGETRFERSYHSKDAGWTQAMVSGVAFDDEGALFATGWSDGDVWFDDVQVSATADSLFVTKLAADGSVEWVYTGPGRNDIGAQLVHALPSGDMAVVGTYMGTPDFGQGPLTRAKTMQPFVLRMNGDGEVLASVDVATAEQAEPSGIDVDADGGIALTGSLLVGSTDSLAGLEMFVAELDPALGLSRMRRFHASEGQFSNDVALDPTGRVILGGAFTGTMDLGDGAKASDGGAGLFVAKLPR